MALPILLSTLSLLGISMVLWVQIKLLEARLEAQEALTATITATVDEKVSAERVKGWIADGNAQAVHIARKLETRTKPPKQ